MFDPQLAAIRFGTGLSPHLAPPRDADALLAELRGPDPLAHIFPIGGINEQLGAIRQMRDLNRAKRENDEARRELRKLRRKLAGQQAQWFANRLARWTNAPAGFQERLEMFWADHFTVVGKSGLLRSFAATHTQDAIRPHLAGRFEDMLIAATTHPMMLAYLDQAQSVGEGSMVAIKRGKGLNENLAREVMELHTLGVGGGYNQTDVRELAKLLAGYSFGRGGQVVYNRRRASPGAEIILGTSYGGERPQESDVHAALRDLARHPTTARHLARKLVGHFVSDRPDPALVEHVAKAYQNSGGRLDQTYGALLEHPSAWARDLVKVKRPFDFVATATRALGVTGRAVSEMKTKDVLNAYGRPLQLMGQKWESPPGPDGWPEEAAHWITPQGLAGRVQWGMTVPQLMLGTLPDPRDFVRTAMGDLAGPQLLFAAQAAETKYEGVGLILASPEFQSR